jgi:hypothetical protein
MNFGISTHGTKCDYAVYKFIQNVGEETREVQRKGLKRMVGARGFEPPTPWSRTRCSTRLSHAPTESAQAQWRAPSEY